MDSRGVSGGHRGFPGWSLSGADGFLLLEVGVVPWRGLG